MLLSWSASHILSFLFLSSFYTALDNFDSSIHFSICEACLDLLSENFFTSCKYWIHPSKHQFQIISHMLSLQHTSPYQDKGLGNHSETSPSWQPNVLTLYHSNLMGLWNLYDLGPYPLSNPPGFTRRPERPRCPDPWAQSETWVPVQPFGSPRTHLWIEFPFIRAKVKVLFIVSHLSGSMFQWVRNIISEPYHSLYSDYSVFKSALKAVYFNHTR